MDVEEGTGEVSLSPLPIGETRVKEGGRTPETVLASGALLSVEGVSAPGEEPCLSPSIDGETGTVKAVRFVPNDTQEWRIPLPSGTGMVRTTEKLCPSPLFRVR